MKYVILIAFASLMFGCKEKVNAVADGKTNGAWVRHSPFTKEDSLRAGHKVSLDGPSKSSFSSDLDTLLAVYKLAGEKQALDKITKMLCKDHSAFVKRLNEYNEDIYKRLEKYK